LRLGAASASLRGAPAGVVDQRAAAHHARVLPPLPERAACLYFLPHHNLPRPICRASLPQDLAAQEQEVEGEDDEQAPEQQMRREWDSLGQVGLDLLGLDSVGPDSVGLDSVGARCSLRRLACPTSGAALPCPAMP
jgi:hypothetical protein